MWIIGIRIFFLCVYFARGHGFVLWIIFFRYGFMVLRSLTAFLRALNSYHETIKFTRETSKEKISSLDVIVSLNDGILSTDVHHKPTDAHQYLNFRSCHPPHVKKVYLIVRLWHWNELVIRRINLEKDCCWALYGYIGITDSVKQCPPLE